MALTKGQAVATAFLLTSYSDLRYKILNKLTPVQNSSQLQFQAALESLLLEIAPPGTTLVLQDDGKSLWGGAGKPPKLDADTVGRSFSALDYNGGPCPTLAEEQWIWQVLSVPISIVVPPPTTPAVAAETRGATSEGGAPAAASTKLGESTAAGGQPV